MKKPQSFLLQFIGNHSTRFTGCSTLYAWSFALLLALPSCRNSGRQPTDGASGDSLRFVFVSTCVNEDFFGPVKQGMADAARLMQVECVFTGTPGVDAQGQVDLMEQAIAEGADGIALNIIDSAVFDEAVAKAIAAGIPVVAFNSDDNHTANARLSAVCQNLYQAGVDLGNKMAPHLSPGSRVLLTVHSDGISALEERVRGIQDALAPLKLEFERLVTTNDIAKATVAIRESLEKNPGINRILCTGLADTEATGNVLAEGLTGRGYLAGGFDLSTKILQHIREGNLLFTIDQQPYMQGFLPVIQLALYARYGILPSDNEIGASFVTPQNVDQVVDLTSKGYR